MGEAIKLRLRSATTQPHFIGLALVVLSAMLADSSQIDGTTTGRTACIKGCDGEKGNASA